ncbi:hypothetical protein [Roseiflexus sp.]|uniref:hypothetical protein n=1 Tax=Roseiflexus sp. TaxID=2562120 RepID=UPI0021DDEA04|nr:hypothetical protein [Roseiflexus sp.]GIV98735.1 MAG: hypothetical protein KatS3mg058_0139 [Roseiflexus sp.]
MSRWSALGNLWSTVREIDVNAIRDEAEQPLSIVAVGHDTALAAIDALARRGPNRYPPTGVAPLTPLSLRDAARFPERMNAADILILAVDSRVGLTERDAVALAQIDRLPRPALLVLLFGTRLAPGSAPLPSSAAAHTVIIPNIDHTDAALRFTNELLERLPATHHLAAARRLPGIRAVYTRRLIDSTAMTNATYALASSLPEQIPILGIPFAVADILVLTKNQAIMVYRLALAYGAPPDFRQRIAEVMPVVGGAFVWREIARTLVGLAPVWGVVPKVGIAYAGTYATGVAAWRWYEKGELIPREELKRIAREAQTIGQEKARKVIAQAQDTREATGNAVKEAASHINSLGNRIRQHSHRTLRRVRERLPTRMRLARSADDSDRLPEEH